MTASYLGDFASLAYGALAKFALREVFKRNCCGGPHRGDLSASREAEENLTPRRKDAKIEESY
jgi:hypothetical protein